MAKLDSLITNATSGEAYNYAGSDRNWAPIIKQTFEVIQNSNYTWTIKSKLYIKLPSTYTSGGNSLGTCFIKIGNQRFDVQEVQIMTTGVWTRGNKISSNAYDWVQILEGTMTYNCSNTGRYGVRLYCGYVGSNDSTYYFTDYTLIYNTFPSFSGLRYKRNNAYSMCMPWLKINGEWKRVKQYIKKDGVWKEYKDSWIWNPEA